ncbi:hypothetical protein ROHU_010767 [Labeo rohita]|uniref:Uncharacterized protein n=1 Tax=Labeo rohita TaxID=84645 RepID=A0A498LUT5_LABRO|nr:hypothetical protein ROHU_010767 [Labeo rohita]
MKAALPECRSGERRFRTDTQSSSVRLRPPRDRSQESAIHCVSETTPPANHITLARSQTALIGQEFPMAVMTQEIPLTRVYFL